MASMNRKWCIAILLILVDYIVFVAPIGSIILAYMIITKDKSAFKLIEDI